MQVGGPSDSRRDDGTAALLDRTRCPACGEVLPGAWCPRCGVDLSGPNGERLWELSSRVASALTERDALLRRLVEDAARRRAPGAPAAVPTAAPARAAAPAIPPAAIPPAGYPPAAIPPAGYPPAGHAAATGPPRPSLVSRIGVQGLLVALGALSLSVAGVVFLVFAWDRLSLGARALVVAGITVAAMGGAAWLRPRLAETAEAIGWLSVVLVLADAWAVRATGLLGTDRVSGPAFAAGAALCCAVLLLGWGLVGRVRAGTVGAALVGPASPVLAGWWLGTSAETLGIRWLAVGLVAAVVVGCAAGWTRAGWQAERTVLAGWSVVALALALLICGAMVVIVAFRLTRSPASYAENLALVLALLAGAAVVQATAHRRLARRGLRSGSGADASLQLWSLAAGAAAASAGAAVAHPDVWAPAGTTPTWWLLAGPVVATGIAWAVLLLAGRARPFAALGHRVASRAARIAALTACVPGALVVVQQVGLVVGAAVAHPWSLALTDGLDRLVAGALLQTDAYAPGSDRAWFGPTPLTVVAAVLGLAGAGVLLGLSRPHRWAPVVAGLIGAALVGAPLSPLLPVTAVVGLGLVVAVATGVVAVVAAARHRLVRPTGSAVASASGVVAVLTAWSVRDLSVPVTVVGLAGLLLAVRGVRPAARPLLVVPWVLATAVTGGAVAALVAGASRADRVVVAAVVGALLAGLLVAVPVPRLDLPAPGVRAERVSGAVAGLVPALAGLAVASGAVATLFTADAAGRVGRYAPGSLALVLVALLVAAAAGAAWPPAPTAPCGPTAPSVLAVAVAPVAAAAAAAGTSALVRALGVPSADRAPAFTLAAALALLVAGTALGLAGPARPADGRRVPAEIGAAFAATVTLLAGTGALWGTDRLWLLWLVLGVGVAAAAVPADRRRGGWAAWALLTASTWARLHDADVGLIEAYTVPPALVLFGAAGLRLRRDRSVAAHRNLRPGLTLALLPSVLACVQGSSWRPAVLIVLAAAALAAASCWVRSPRTSLLGDVALAASVVVAAGAGAVRSVAAVRDAALAALTTTDVVEPLGLEPYRVEVWSLGAAVVLAAAGVLALRRPGWLRPPWRSAAGLPALALAAGPSLYAAFAAVTTYAADDVVTAPGWSDDAAAARAAAVLLGAGALAVVRAWRPRTPLLGRLLARCAAVTVLLAAGVGLLTGFGEVETWTAPAGLVLLAVGALGLARLPALRSWRTLGPGLALLLGPSLVLALPGDDLWRVVGLAVVSAIVVVVGAGRRLQAPAVAGGTVLAVHALAQLGPWVVRTMAGQPRWVTLGIVGIVLLGLGATYERRLRELRSLRTRLDALR